MIRAIMTKRFFLRQPSEAATADDLGIAEDLAETLEAHRAHCVGMAANMIGERKRIIAVLDGAGKVLVMFNPRIVKAEGPYEAEEGCLSLEGIRTAQRFRRIVVAYDDERLQAHEDAFDGFVAQTIQHEVDHCNGVII